MGLFDRSHTPLLIKQTLLERYLFQLLAVAGAYFATARLGMILAFPGTNATPLWLPTGVALSAVLLLGRRMWPGIALGAFIVNFQRLSGLGLSMPAGLGASLFTAGGNTLEALAGAYLIHRFTGEKNPFGTSAHVFAFINFGALISTTLSATIGTATFCVSVAHWMNFPFIWLTWWLGDALGAIILVPLVMTYKGLAATLSRFRPVAGTFVLWALLVVVGSLVFLMSYPLEFLLLPILIVSAFRLGQFGSAMTVAIMSGLSVYGTVNGTGPFADKPLDQSFLLVQGLVGSFAIATMVLASILAEKKQSAVKLRESEELFRSAFEQAAVGIAFLSPEGKWLRMNQRLCDIVGYSKEEMSGLSFQDFTHPDDLETDLAYIRQVINHEIETYSMEKRYLRKDRTWVWIHLTVSLLRWPLGQPKYFISIIEDITARKNAEEERQRINHDLRAVNRVVLACASTMDMEEILNRVMDEALEITGLEGGTLCFVTPEQTLEIAVHRETSEATLQDLTTHAIKVGECLCGECARIHKPLILTDRQAVLKFSTREATRGEDIRFHAAFPLVAGERCLGVLCVFTRGDGKPTDASLRLLETVSAQVALAIDNARLYAETVQQAATLDEKVQERTAELDRARQSLMNLVEDLNSANEQLKELDRFKSMFIASMSHELRTPLNSIIGFSGLILGDMVGPISEAQRDMLGRVSRAGKHLLALITDVIDIAKIESGKVVPYPKAFVLADLVQEAVGQVEAQALEKGLTIQQHVPEEPIRMHTDQRRLLQCLLNYLSNAVKFSEKGGVTITAEKRGPKSQDPGKVQEWVEISVRDTGIGIRQEDMKRLFSSFVRFETGLKTVLPGTGLGLYLTKKLATEVLGGFVGAESEPGKGSLFWIRIPLVRTTAP